MGGFNEKTFETKGSWGEEEGGNKEGQKGGDLPNEGLPKNEEPNFVEGLPNKEEGTNQLKKVRDKIEGLGDGNNETGEKTLENNKEKNEDWFEKLDEEEKERLMGDFYGYEIEEGKIMLSDEEIEEVKKQMATIKEGFGTRWLPSVFRGDRTARGYEGGSASNFSTRTNIIELKDGKRVFAIYTPPLSQIHRWLDAWGKSWSGDRMNKVSRKEWKKTFEERSNIPVIRCNDPYLVLLPYIFNINGYDALAYNNSISEPDGCDWVKDLNLENKTEMLIEVVGALAAMHNRDRTQGETILQNVIFDRGKSRLLLILRLFIIPV